MKKKIKQANNKANLIRLKKELEEKKRELKIEASLEKVRTVALRMKEPADMLKVCKIISNQLIYFGLNDIRNVQTVILQEQKNSYLNYQYFTFYNKSIIEEAEYNKHPKAREMAETVKKSANAFFSQSFRGKSLEKFRKYRKDDNQLSDPLLDKSSSVHFYFYSIGPGALGLSTYNTPLNKENLSLLKRFRNVFELAYKRFVDIEQAIAQTKEAQIEASLERVRAVAMGMNKPDDILDIGKTLFVELKKLDFGDIRNTLISIFNDDGGYFLDYDYSNLLGGSISKIYYNSHSTITNFINQIRKAEDAFAEHIVNSRQMKKWEEFRKIIGKQPDPRLEKVKVLYYYNYSIASGSIGISNFEQINHEQREILKRFRNVFDLAYRRYEDIALAAAQAREAQIEASLEKVRASAMSMHKSDHLLDVCEILFGELHKLGFVQMRNAMINIHDDEKGTFINYDYSDEIGRSINNLTYNIHPVIEKQIKQIRSANDAFSETSFTGKDLNEWKKFRQKIGEKDDRRIKNISALYYYFYSIGNGSIGISTFSPINEEKLLLLKRFRNVFNLAYKRYSDISLAEAQAREAQIEVALERVRAKAMAMHTSNDLSETMGVLFIELPKLGISSLRCGVVLLSRNSRRGVFYAAATTSESDSFTMIGSGDMAEHPVFLKQYNFWLKNENYFLTLSDKELHSYYRALFARLSIPYTPKEHNIQTEHGYYLAFSEGMFYVWTEEPYSENQINILNRFKAIIDLTFRRYLDLQKAEAQAREAQIELALERVRAKTMAMRRSEELQETSFVLFEQMRSLGETAEQLSIGIFNENEGVIELSITLAGSQLPKTYEVPFDEPFLMGKAYQAWKAKKRSFVYELSGKTLQDYNQYRDRVLGGKLTSNEKSYTKRIVYFAFFSKGVISFSSHEERPSETIALMERFAAVFDLTYTRFNDLKKAEAQAREAQIEAALERVRSRTMGMQKSEELKEVIKIVHQQLTHLNIKLDHAGFVVDYTPRGDWHFWIADERDIPSKITHPYFESVWANQFNEAKEKGVDFFTTNLNFEEKNKFYNELLSYVPGLPEASKEFYLSCPGLAVTTVLMDNVGLYIENFSGTPYTDEENAVLMRFGKVFQQTYTRFLDLQKAEEQAREVEIQLALERVRARSLAMHNTSELQEVVNIVAQQLHNMNIDINGGVFIVINDEVDKDIPLWASGGAADYVQKVVVPFLNKPVFVSMKDAIKRKNNFFTEEHSQEEKILLFEHLFKYPPWNSLPPERKQELLSREGGYTRSVAISQYTSISITNHNGKIFSYDDNEILKRFGSVFEQSYIRFLDLQKAEAQAREAQIEAALEKVRSRTMAMQRSDELSETAFVLFQQFKELGMEPKMIAIGVMNEQERIMDFWVTDWSGGGSKVDRKFKASIDEPVLLSRIYAGWKERKKSTEIELSNEELKAWIDYRVKLSGTPDEKDYSKAKGYVVASNFSKGIISVSAYEPQSPETVNLLERFAGVFDLTYTRFLDLKKAEAQANEARIEASLEKVRAKAMSMHTPDDLSETVSMFFKELKSLSVLPWRCGVGRIDEETRTTYLTTTSITKEREIIEVSGKLKQTGHPVLDGIFDHWKMQKEYYPVLRGEDIHKYYSIIKPQIAYPDYPLDAVQYGHNIPFKEGFIFAWTENRLSEDQLQIFRRFSSVLSLTYRRYMDLKESEARAIQSVRQAALDRVRAEIASMRTSEDLNRITPIIWRELKTLDVPFFRCGVYIVDEKNESVRVYLTTPDGKSLGVLKMGFYSNELTKNNVESWKRQQIYHAHWNREDFINWTKLMVEQGQVPNAETYQGYAEPPESLDLHFVPFAQGMLYIGNESPLDNENLELVKSLAEAFSIAYARYEDFKNLEDAKNKVEITLNELKSAQAQLIHSEKMASLGELTAGIAHEIKNPLNFVNNFSEVSKELLDELKSELQNKNLEEVIEIVEDLKQNLDKINQHGKRADSIVKGMLLHSRGTSGEKTLTDINDLLDQYVNLAYHGMRAQNKDFNITIEKDYDKSLEKINVVPQDISRVFLNIINNACYAAYERKKQSGKDFSPKINVFSKKLNEKVEIRIGDNGNGIPADHLDKIFQPFFTTKPTGEGTGLGLSLSYDIVTKVHGGELKVDTKEGRGTVFIIILNN